MEATAVTMGNIWRRKTLCQRHEQQMRRRLISFQPISLRSESSSRARAGVSRKRASAEEKGMSVLLSRTGSAGRNHRDCHGDVITVTVTVTQSP
jgi:hypothetical protein